MMSETQQTAAPSQAQANPLLKPWQTPFETPPFAEILPEHFLPAFERAFADHAGAGLDEAAKKRRAEINERLAELGTSFSHHLLGDEQDWFMELGEDDRGGLPDAFVAAAKAAAVERGMAGKAIVTLSRSSVEPFLKSSSRRDLREKAYRAFTARGDNGNANDNNAAVVEILALRDESAKIMGFPTYAAYRLEDSMAKTPEAVRSLLERVWKP